MIESLFVTGTDTDVGKTVVSAALTLGLQATYWKPIQSGLLPCTDTEWVKRVTGLKESHFISEAYRLERPLSPHASAKLDGVSISLKQLQLPEGRPLIVEGAGGVLVPLNEDQLMIDLIKQLSLPVLIVARSTLGTINHTLLTLAELRRCQIPIKGVVLNGPKNEGNKHAIEHYGKVKVIGEIEPCESLDRAALLHIYNNLKGPENA